jgi:hypothetical protein
LPAAVAAACGSVAKGEGPWGGLRPPAGRSIIYGFAGFGKLLFRKRAYREQSVTTKGTLSRQQTTYGYFLYIYEWYNYR